LGQQQQQQVSGQQQQQQQVLSGQQKQQKHHILQPTSIQELYQNYNHNVIIPIHPKNNGYDANNSFKYGVKHHHSGDSMNSFFDYHNQHGEININNIHNNSVLIHPNNNGKRPNNSKVVSSTKVPSVAAKERRR